MWMAAIQGGGWWCPMCGGHGGWGMAGMWIFWLVVVVALVAAVMAVLRRSNTPAAPGPGLPESSEEIIRRRYAAGEIDRETYLRMLEDLGSGDR